MRRTTLYCCFLILSSTSSFSQNENRDSSVTLKEVILKAFEQNRNLQEVNAAVNFVSQKNLQRFNDMSVLPALNALPGVRMEERSPGSYRMNIRGSTLRSPFGVRNVKVYFNGIPFTDPGGNTYLNQLSAYNFYDIEIIKGPGSSMYGSGSGGVMLIDGFPDDWEKGVKFNLITGSYGLNNFNAEINFGNDDHKNLAGFTHQVADGYRDHSKLRRDVFNWQSVIRANEKQEMKMLFLYGDLYYQTPGGLTRAEYDSASRMARPKAGTLPSADMAKAAVFQKTMLAGLTNKFLLGDHWQNSTVFYGAFTSFRNPTFRVYERRIEPHFGGRTSFKYGRKIRMGSMQFVAGAEGQRGFFNTKTFSNVNGNPGTVQTDDDLSNWAYLFFAQADLHTNDGWGITLGASMNRSSVTITRLSVPSFVPIKRSFSDQWAPRIAVSKKLFKYFSLYGSIAKGFSPPTVAELLPGTVAINTTLQPEQGTNYELGLRASLLKNNLFIELNRFYYHLSNAIVVRKDANNGDFYINAGSTKQHGFESRIHYSIPLSKNNFLNNAQFDLAYTNYNFHYREFKQSSTDYSGNQLPSVAPATFCFSMDLGFDKGFFLGATYFYSDRIFLNDANTASASSYQLLGGKLGWETVLSKTILMQIFVGADNLFDTKYSLGNDINAAGNRFYNTAAGRNFYAGLKLQMPGTGKNKHLL